MSYDELSGLTRQAWARNVEKENKALEKENAALREFKEKVNKELRIWNNEDCSESAYMKALCNIEEMMLEGGENE